MDAYVLIHSVQQCVDQISVFTRSEGVACVPYESVGEGQGFLLLKVSSYMEASILVFLTDFV